MIKFCISSLCLIVLCMKVTAYKKLYLPNSICTHYCEYRASYKFNKTASSTFDWETCYPTSYEYEHTYSENDRLMKGCPVVPTCNDDSYVNWICWGIYGLNICPLTQPICKFSRQEVKLRCQHRQKRGRTLIVLFKYHINVYNLLKYQLSTKNLMVLGWVVKLYSLPQVWKIFCTSLMPNLGSK